MTREVTAESFSRLLDALDRDRDRAGEKYEELRRILIRFFEWRGAPFPEEHADETFDRVSRKLGAILEISNIGGYCYEVARLVCLEALKGRDRRSISIDSMAMPPADTASVEPAALASRFACLESCLGALPGESRELILEYYRDEGRGRIDRRKAMAERLGVPRETLANRAQRVRDRLERCVSECLDRPRPYEDVTSSLTGRR
jgi:DNA-directed RNA polymerase specialized sigma24 family protein